MGSRPLSFAWATVTTLLSLTTLYRSCEAQSDFSIPSEYTSWDNDNWVLSTNQLLQGQFQSRAPIANGYFGCGVAAAGPFFEADVNFTNPDGGILPINGWPLDNPRQTFCTVSGFFNLQHNTTRTNFPENLALGAESVIAGIPNWPNLILEVDDHVLDATVDNSTISNFQSSRSLKNGLLSWKYNWAPSSTANLSIAYEMFIDRSNPNVAAIQLTINSGSDVNATVIDLLDGRGAVRSDPGEKGQLNDSNTIYTSVSPHWLGDVTAWIYSTVDSASIANGTRQNASETFYKYGNDSTIGQAFPVSLKANTPTIITKYVGVASSDGFENPQQTAREASIKAVGSGYGALFNGSAAAWAELMDSSLVDDYSNPDGSVPSDPNVLNMHIVSKANAHYLLQSTTPSDNASLARWSISVGGLTSDSYAGLVFWDADLFMSPGISVAHPKYSYQIANYRVQLAEQAKKNAVFYNYSQGSILFPWTSGRFGNCTGTGPCTDYQYHLNNDIFLNNLLYWRINGNDDWFQTNALPINEGVLQMYSQLMQYNSTVNGYSIRNLTDPDEYANQVQDGAYTLAAVAKDIEFAQGYAAQFNITLPANYSDIAGNPALPFAPSGVLTEYFGANNSAVIKQDDVDLINYPLDYSSENYTDSDKLTSLDYYSNLQSPDGPAMTFSLYSISANALSPSGCSAYTYGLQGFQPYARAPWYQFSEQQDDNYYTNGGTNPAFPFLTGAGGWHQIGPMGWLGMRAVEEQLILQPALPPQIPHVSLRTVIFAGTGLKATLNYTHTTITRVDVSRYLPTNSTDKYNGKPLPFTVGFSLATGTNMTINMGQTVTIENRRYFDNVTNAGNILQCLPATSEEGTYPGQFPLAAVDGAASTRWQPASRNATAMTVDTRHVQYQPVTGVSFDWGARPPVSVRVSIYNGSSDSSTSVTVATFSNISISAPYNASTQAIIRPYVGNMSFYAFSQPVYSGDYVSLAIAGCAENDTAPATVGEFNLYGARGGSLLQSAQNGSEVAGNSTLPVTTVTASSTSGAPSQVATGGLSTGSASGSGSSPGQSSYASPRVSAASVFTLVVGALVVGAAIVL
ncbi:carbohydrate-binding module family 32 protein [Myriangium duriaei CBS 260.36]|uniref:alpha,alpha-trehalase n=1 Tax=Myriangium duriaei CBS 260.36 TaxID=1168546 RepID=A0A9P4JDH2_9PEZI|nr:carbohydrate-binding module family 32 protein [Myriangium duriaei CBS 260.36]